MRWPSVGPRRSTEVVELEGVVVAQDATNEDGRISIGVTQKDDVRAMKQRNLREMPRKTGRKMRRDIGTR